MIHPYQTGSFVRANEAEAECWTLYRCHHDRTLFLIGVAYCFASCILDVEREPKSLKPMIGSNSYKRQIRCRIATYDISFEGFLM